MTTPSTADLSGLRAGASPGPERGAIPAPPRRWLLRAGLPLAMVLAVAVVAAIALRDAVVPAIDVRVAPAVLRPGDTVPGAGVSPESPRMQVVAQAAGWLEPDPYPISISALTSGVVAEVLVLEGERVEAGQVLVRLVDDEAALALARAKAELDMRRALQTSAEGAARAARETWENPVERTKA